MDATEKQCVDCAWCSKGSYQADDPDSQWVCTRRFLLTQITPDPLTMAPANDTCHEPRPVARPPVVMTAADGTRLEPRPGGLPRYVPCIASGSVVDELAYTRDKLAVAERSFDRASGELVHALDEIKRLKIYETAAQELDKLLTMARKGRTR